MRGHRVDGGPEERVAAAPPTLAAAWEKVLAARTVSRSLVVDCAGGIDGPQGSAGAGAGRRLHGHACSQLQSCVSNDSDSGRSSAGGGGSGVSAACSQVVEAWLAEMEAKAGLERQASGRLQLQLDDPAAGPGLAAARRDASRCHQGSLQSAADAGGWERARSAMIAEPGWCGSVVDPGGNLSCVPPPAFVLLGVLGAE